MNPAQGDTAVPWVALEAEYQSRPRPASKPVKIAPEAAG